MEAVAGIATLLFIVSGTIVGLRLLLLAKRTGQLPEWAVGTSLFVMSGIAYPLMLAARVTDEGTARALSSVATFALALGWSGAFVFTWKVFRPDAAWARAFALLCIVALFVAAAAGAHHVLTAPLTNEIFQISVAGNTLVGVGVLCYCWTGVESIRYHALLKKRLALGLTDALTVNRFLLWGLIAVFALVSILPAFVVGLLGGDTMGSAILRLFTAVGGLATSAMLLLAFLPPAWYRRAITGAGPAADSAV